MDTPTLTKTLIKLKLASPAQIDGALYKLGHAKPSPEELLQALESAGTLTTYQTAKLRKGDTEGLVVGRYKLLYRNASGSFARVYRACSTQDGRMVGLKVLRQRWAKSPEAIRDFLKEAELGRALKHPHIVPIYDVGHEGGLHYFTMEFVEGGNLRDFINIRKKLAPREATKCIMEMADALSYAAAQGAMHRDLKMTNVLMSSQGQALLVDFGLSAPAFAKDDEQAQRALDYATLEKNTGAPRDDPRSDLYFLGCIFYELLTGSSPIERTKDRVERGQFSRYELVVPLRTVDPSLPEAVVRIVDRLMQLRPELRYQTAADAFRDLRAALAQFDYGDLGIPSEGENSGVGLTSPNSLAKRAAPARTIMIVEHRVKPQDTLREYFTKHGYRVLMMSDLRRALGRVETSPPDCLLIVGDAVEDEALSAYQESVRLNRSAHHATILLLGKRQLDLLPQIEAHPHAAVLAPPATLRDLRKQIEALLAAE